jgi:hypothetical protein
MSRWTPQACDHTNCLRVAAAKVYLSDPARFEYLCEVHLPISTGIADVDDLIEDIASGTCDAYLEAILAATHGRKRALRNIPHPYGRTEE